MKILAPLASPARICLLSLVAVLFGGCAATSPGSTGSATELDQLRAQVKTLQEENKLLSLKLQDEIERSTIQVFLVRQEVAAAKRQIAAVRAQCGSACAESPR